MSEYVDGLRNRAVELRIEGRELAAQRDEIAARIEANRAEQEKVRNQLLTAKPMHVQSAPSSARGTIARMGTFTISEALGELGWDEPQLKKLLDAMMCEKPPTIVKAGRLSGKMVYRYEGPAINTPADAHAEREAGALEAVREWLLTQDVMFSPHEAAAAVGVPRATALRALRTLETMDVLVDEGPTSDMPLFRRTGTQAPDVAITRPDLKLAEPPPPLSKIPQIQSLIEAAQASGCEVVASNGHYAVEALDGRRCIIDGTPQGRSRLLQDKASLRRIGVQV